MFQQFHSLGTYLKKTNETIYERYFHIMFCCSCFTIAKI